ncbi:Uncharacterised protein [Klebsiella pneumoniae]|uniref:Uncharacterized protein n=1 Tax=Klebsiella pneumoniae TaxID=573 RepID=A0A4P0XTA7_KLEPN|nr:Uncharacterised protein [Klebsiella pneumoniae]
MTRAYVDALRLTCPPAFLIGDHLSQENTGLRRLASGEKKATVAKGCRQNDSALAGMFGIHSEAGGHLFKLSLQLLCAGEIAALQSHPHLLG